MSSMFHDLRSVSPGSYKWKIKVRVIRFWRGVSTKGEVFKSFNLLFLDDKNCRLHAFVPGSISDEKQEEIIVGRIYIISNFNVKEYKPYERFRCVRADKQIIFTTYTKIQEVAENDTLIQENEFDFFDLGDLMDVAKQNVYLTDIVGLLKKDLPLKHLVNCNGDSQVQQKFKLTDGRSTVNVTFWDKFAEELEEMLGDDLEEPVIMIIASAKIYLWEDNIQVGHVSSSRFYLNYNHHSVTELRQRYNSGEFSDQDFCSHKSEVVEKFNLQEILSLGADFTKKEVVCDLKIGKLDTTMGWFFCSCTSCYREIQNDDETYRCVMCNSIIPYPLKKFRLFAKSFDSTGKINMILEDREVRTLIGKTVYDFIDEEPDENKFPDIFRTIEDKDYSVKLFVKQANTDKLSRTYLATDIYESSLLVHSEEVNVSCEIHNYTDSPNDASTSTYHLDNLSQLSFKSPEFSQKKKRTLRPLSKTKKFGK